MKTPAPAPLWKALATSTLAAAATLGCLEVALRIEPRLGGTAFANGLKSKYRLGPAGIYFYDPQFPVTKIMKPRHHARLEYNGYSWAHSTDSHGFRNEQERSRADVLLLGDSFIYGHGLESRDTVAAVLESMTGLPVMNMGRQGDSTIDELCILQGFISGFQPRDVVVFFYQNDIDDITRERDPGFLRWYLAAPSGALPCSRPPPSLLRGGTDIIPGPDAPREVPRWMRSAPRGGPFLLRLMRGMPSPRRLAYRLFVDRGDSLLALNAHERSVEWRTVLKALKEMEGLARRSGATFWLAPIVPARSPTMAENGRILRMLAKQSGMNVIDTTRFDAFETDDYLPGDGHFSPAGARRMATIVAAALASSADKAPRLRPALATGRLGSPASTRRGPPLPQ